MSNAINFLKISKVGLGKRITENEDKLRDHVDDLKNISNKTKDGSQYRSPQGKENRSYMAK